MHPSQPIESSIIIPVYNQWQLTRKCLEALHATLRGRACEIIVIDNASTDPTREHCPALGKELFGTLFHYHRAERNLNFGPASNLGARMASGEFLVFLNNDTEPLPGWYEPLIADFTAYADIACTGPLLLYPEEGPLGRTVQHLGVVASPKLLVSHLYEGIPEASPLAKKRRFFQIITAACLVMRRSLFLETGLFDEGYINGCEDIDLCLRLWKSGYRMTVNPAAKVIHHTSQTPGRFKHDEHNFRLLSQKAFSILTPDWHIHLQNDRLVLALTPWQVPIASYSQEQRGALSHIFTNSSLNTLRDRLIDFPLWEEGYGVLAKMLSEQGASTRLLDITHNKLFRNQEYLLACYLKASEAGDDEHKDYLWKHLLTACSPYEDYVFNARFENTRLTKLGLHPLADLYASWLENRRQFRDERYFPLMHALWKYQHAPETTGDMPLELYRAGDYAKTEGKHSLFDPGFYTRQYPELAASSHSPFIHYILQGKAQGALHREPKTLLAGHDGSRQELHDTALKDNACRVIAWYSPHFHPDGETDVAFGKGHTKWTRVAAAAPRFEGHYQPRLPGALGFYDQRRKETLEEQIALAKHAGIYGFCLHHYWFHGQELLQAPLNHLKNNPELDFPFCLHWLNDPLTRYQNDGTQDIIIHQRHTSEDDLAFIRGIAWALRDKRYITFEGKPLLGIARPELFPDIGETISRWRHFCRHNGIGEIFLFASQSSEISPTAILNYGFDGAVELPPHGCGTAPIWSGCVDQQSHAVAPIRRYSEARDFFLTATSTVYTRPVFRGVLPGWDNSAVCPQHGEVFAGTTAKNYAAWLETALERARNDAYTGEKFVFINAWNGWDEGACLEPDARYGAAMLNATARVLDKDKTLPHILFICNPDNAEQSQWLENSLAANILAPSYRPVVLSPRPTHSTGTFKGLAPLIIAPANITKQELVQTIKQNGYFSFELGVILQDITLELLEGIASLSGAVMVPEGTATRAVSHLPGGIWQCGNAHLPVTDWTVVHTITQETTTARLLLKRGAQQSHGAVDISLVLLLPQTSAISLDGLALACQATPLHMETLVPQPLETLCAKILPKVQGVPASHMADYIHRAVELAKGRAIWLIAPDSAVSADIPQALYTPLMEEGIVSARPAFPPQTDCLPRFTKGHTLTLSGQEIIMAARKKNKAILPHISAALFKRESLLVALDQREDGKFDLEWLVQAVYDEGHVALVPFQYEG